jgi:pyruvate,water dikinase
MQDRPPYIIRFSDSESVDVAKVGGKNASLGDKTRELEQVGIAIPAGFAIGVEAYWSFVEANGLRKKIAAALDDYKQGRRSLADTGGTIRTEFMNGELPADVASAITCAYRALSREAARILAQASGLS